MKYTDEDLKRGLQQVIDKLGRPPTAEEYDQHRDDGDASAQTIRRRLGYPDTIRSLGYQPKYEQHIPNEQLKRSLQQVIDKLGRPPTTEEYSQHRNDRDATWETISERFGGFPDAIRSLGYNPHTRYSDEELKQSLQRVIAKLNRPPLEAEYNQHRDDRDAGSDTIRNRFGGFPDAIRLLGYQPQSHYTREELTQSLQRVIDKLGRPPDGAEYNQHRDDREGGVGAFANEFGGFPDAVRSLGYQPKDGKYTDEELKDDLQRVIDKLGRSPTTREYNQHGKATAPTIGRRLGGFPDAVRSLGYQPQKEYLSQEAKLKDFRRVVEQTTAPPSPCDRYMESDDSRLGISTLHTNFGSKWRAAVRAGIAPYRAPPLTPLQYKSFVHYALDSKPLQSFYGQLMAFTGLSTRLLSDFDFSWIDRLESSRRTTLITVPADQLNGSDDWVITVPETWTDPVTGTTKQTTINELLKFLRSKKSIIYQSGITDIAHQCAENVGVDPDNIRMRLRATSAVHLAKREIPTWKIKHQIGSEKTGWARSVEDYYLYNYQFHGITHPDYEPSGVYLDPDSGDVKRVDSKAN